MNGPPKTDLAAFEQELEYTAFFKSRNLHPGRWPTVGRTGGGYSFEKFERLSSHPDFRRIDFLATARNPLAEEPLVRVSKPSAKLDLILVADLSLSISCGFSESKIVQIAKLAVLFGYTAFRMGDRFGFIGFDNRVIEGLFYPPSRRPNVGLEIGEEILKFRPSVPFQGSALDLGRHVPESKSVLVLVSDFYFPPKSFRAILKPFARHQVIPIVLRQARERRWPAGLFGVLKLKDSESRREKTVFFSPGSVRRFEEKCRADEEEIRRVFASASAFPIFLEDVDPERLLWELSDRP